MHSTSEKLHRKYIHDVDKRWWRTQSGHQARPRCRWLLLWTEVQMKTWSLSWSSPLDSDSDSDCHKSWFWLRGSLSESVWDSLVTNWRVKCFLLPSNLKLTLWLAGSLWCWHWFSNGSTSFLLKCRRLCECCEDGKDMTRSKCHHPDHYLCPYLSSLSLSPHFQSKPLPAKFWLEGIIGISVLAEKG